MSSAPPAPLRAPSKASVTLMARVPPELAAQAQAYATAHGLPISTLVRAGLTWVLTQPPALVAPLPASPALAPTPRPTPLRLGGRIARVLRAYPEGIDVASITTQLNAGKAPRHRTWTLRAQVGQWLRHQYKHGQVVRLARGVYANPPPLPPRWEPC